MKTIIIGALLLLPVAANAQDEKMTTDRPGFTIDPGTVLKKWVQAETGFSRQTEKKTGPQRSFYAESGISIKIRGRETG